MLKPKIFILIFFLFICVSCNDRKDSTNIKILGNSLTITGKYKTEYIVHYNTYNNVKYEIYSDKEIYVCSFQGTNFLLEKDNPEEILSTTAPIQIIKSEIVK